MGKIFTRGEYMSMRINESVTAGGKSVIEPLLCQAFNMSSNDVRNNVLSRVISVYPSPLSVDQKIYIACLVCNALNDPVRPSIFPGDDLGIIAGGIYVNYDKYCWDILGQSCRCQMLSAAATTTTAAAVAALLLIGSGQTGSSSST